MRALRLSASSASGGTSMQRRNLKLKGKFESGSSHFSFKR
jgi:hypothetical protein